MSRKQCRASHERSTGLFLSLAFAIERLEGPGPKFHKNLIISKKIQPPDSIYVSFEKNVLSYLTENKILCIVDIIII